MNTDKRNIFNKNTMKNTKQKNKRKEKGRKRKKWKQHNIKHTFIFCNDNT